MTAQELRTEAEQKWELVVYYDKLGDYDSAEEFAAEHRDLIKRAEELEGE